MADIKISELTQAESLSTSDLLESAVPYNGGFLSRRMSLAQLSNYLENYVQHQALTTTAKTIVSAINEIVSDLENNYYKTSQTYSKTQVDQLIAGVSGLHFEVVQQLPTTDIDVNTIYLVPKQDVGTQDIYDEYICLDDTTTPATWEKIGTTEIDLSDYVTDTELTTILNDYVTSSGLSTILANYATTSAMTTALADKVDKVSGKGLSTEDYTTAEKTKVNGLATVATSGSYNDLTDKPTIPTNTDEKVKQTAVSSSSNENYRLLLSKSASNTEETDGVQKSGSLYYNPYDDKVTVQNVDISNTANIATAKVTNLITSQYYFSLGSGSAVAMLEANSASTTSNPTFVTLPASSGTLALQSDITSAINDLDVASTSIAASKTLATIKEENGKIAVTTQDIKINQGQIDNTCIVGTQSAISGSVTWHKFASTTITGVNTDCIIMLAVNDTYIPDTDSASDTNGGILYCRVRQASPVGTFAYAKLKFVANSGLDASKFRLYYTTSASGITFELWTNLTRQYAYRRFTIINQGQRTVAYANNAFTLHNSTTPSAPPTESNTCKRVECEDNTYKQTDNNILGAKNLIPYPYINGQGSYYVRNNVTITVNENGVISASGTAPSSGFEYGLSTKANPIILDPTKSYIMSGMKNGSSSTIRFLLDLWTENQNPETDAYTTRLYQATTETIIPSGYKYLQITLYFYTGASSLFPLTVSPMLRLASIADSTFEPYAQTNRQLTINKMDWNDYAEYGVKNLIPYPWEHKNGRVNRGITFGCSGEGYVTFNGTASTTQEPFFSYTGTSSTSVANGTYLKISGNKRYRIAIERTDDRLWAIAYVRNLDGTDTSNLNIYVEFEDGSTTTKSSNVNLRDSGINHTSLYFTIPTNDEYLLQVDVRCSANTGSYSSSTAKGRVILQPYEISDLSWMPYAKSNYELTTLKAEYKQISTVELTDSASRAYAKNELMIWRGDLHRVTQAITSGGSITLNTNVVATTLSAEIKAIRDALNI